MSTTKIQHKSPRLEELAALCSTNCIAAVYAFGSLAEQAKAWINGNIEFMSRTGSDLDIGVLPEPKVYLSARSKVELTLDFEDFFNIHRVDLVVLPEAPPYLASNIIQGKRLYARDEDMADEYDLYVLRKAGDLMPFHRQRIALILGDDE